MPSFSSNSKEKLASAHVDLQKIFAEVIKHRDCTILYGHRTSAEQFELFKKGREFQHGQWAVADRSKVVIYLDGHDKKSKHNHMPSRAVDCWKFPIDWEDKEEMHEFAGFVLGISQAMFDRGEIGNEIEWGGNWSSFKDMPHFEIKE